MRRARRARWAKLDNVLPEEQRQEAAWASRSLVSTGLNRLPAEPLTPHLTALRRAIRERRTVHMVYAGMAGPATTERDVNPYALVHRTGWWYAVGHCHLRDAMRTFRVDRVVRLEPYRPHVRAAATRSTSTTIWNANGAISARCA